ncbi:MAG: quinoprotein dehydrogenase-associated putative ABC transporter substrate-binding protein [Proteobacteria bacterium]|nr:quinoprotein dehydrogenase-associated putative ABC transporter substrate-binding protein [Pseudomonadota bacterium]
MTVGPRAARHGRRPVVRPDAGARRAARAGVAQVAAAAVMGLTALALPGQSRAQLRVCADPGNMPLSNSRGEGLENRMAQVLARALGTTVEYYYRPGIERGLIRNTLDADRCDVMFDMPSDAEDVLTTAPLYRSTFVFVSRADRRLHFSSLDDPRLRALRIGVYETSAIREALSDHGIGNVQVHYLSHDADLKPQDQPSYQVQQVIEGTLDVAAAWGPMAGYYRVAQHSPLTIQPVNLMDDEVPLQFDMALAVRRGDHGRQQQLEQAMRSSREALAAALKEFAVPLVQCERCLISGDLPAHGPYRQRAPAPRPAGPAVSIAQVEDWLAHGADLTTELNNAVLADDQARVGYLLQKRHADVNALDLQGEAPLHNAIVQRLAAMAGFLLAHGADVNRSDRDGWTPIMTAAYCDDAAEVRALAARGADLNAASRQNLTALGVAAQYGKEQAALALVELGADPGRAVGEGGYTPLMIASANGAPQLARALIARGADVNAGNAGGVTALMLAVSGGRTDMMDILLRAGASVQARSHRGDTALSIARARGDREVIALLDARPGA